MVLLTSVLSPSKVGQLGASICPQRHSCQILGASKRWQTEWTGVSVEKRRRSDIAGIFNRYTQQNQGELEECCIGGQSPPQPAVSVIRWGSGGFIDLLGCLFSQTRDLTSEESLTNHRTSNPKGPCCPRSRRPQEALKYPQ